MVSGFAGAFPVIAVSAVLDDQAWDVNKHYLFWTWIALLAGMWANGFNVARAVGAVRGALQLVGYLFSPWFPTLLVTLNLISAACTAALREALTDYLEASRLALTSPRGLVITGFGLAYAVAASNVVTTVVRDQCSSAYTLTFLTARQRGVDADGVVGFHLSHSIVGDHGQGWSPVEHLVAVFMGEHCVTESFVQRAVGTPGWRCKRRPCTS